MRIKARIFFPDHLAKPSLVLVGEEAHYLTKVLHSAVGEGVILFGEGTMESLYRIEDLHADRVRLALLETREALTESPVDLTLVIAVGKGKKLEEIVERTTALGVKKVLPFVGRHSIAKKSNPRLQERLEILAREACRQSRRTSPPVIEPVLPTLDQAMEVLSPKRGTWVFLDERGGAPPCSIVGRGSPETPWVLFCGPEGGWHPNERELLEHRGSVRASLGPRVLRTELAATVAVAIFENLLSTADVRSG